MAATASGKHVVLHAVRFKICYPGQDVILSDTFQKTVIYSGLELLTYALAVVLVHTRHALDCSMATATYMF